jgi:hypothetical protein
MTKSQQKRLAGVTLDAWLGEPKPAKFVETNKYSNQLIAFLDVLGITNLIKRHNNHDEHIAIDKIERINKIVETSTNIFRESVPRIDYLHISDSFVFCVRA